MDWIKIGEINAPELSTIAWNVLRYAQLHKIGLHGREIKITRLAVSIKIIKFKPQRSFNFRVYIIFA